MSEIQTATQNNGQTTQRFIELIMMQGQQAMLCMGRLPHPSTGETMVNLEAARMFIDHLEVIHQKTKGNLSKEEEDILTNVLSDLQLNFVHVTQDNLNKDKKEEAEIKIEDPLHTSSQEEAPKRFSKSYGS